MPTPLSIKFTETNRSWGSSSAIGAVFKLAEIEAKGGCLFVLIDNDFTSCGCKSEAIIQLERRNMDQTNRSLHNAEHYPVLMEGLWEERGSLFLFENV